MKPGKRPPSIDTQEDDGPPEPVNVGAIPGVNTTRPRRRKDFGQAPKSAREPAGWPLYLLAFVVSVLWLAAPAAYAYRYHPDILQRAFDPFVAAALGLMA